jgi:hypothetical protein
MNSVHTLSSYFFKFHFNIILCPDLPGDFFSSGFPLGLIALMFGEENSC